MNEENLTKLVSKGLGAMKAGCATAIQAQGDIMQAAANPDLKSTLEQGQTVTDRWRERIDTALSAMSSNVDVPGDNPVQEALYEEAQRIREQAPDDVSRDLGIVAAGQQALHYWIASFGTMAAYAKKLGMNDVAAEMHTCVEEARQADEKHNELAETIMQ